MCVGRHSPGTLLDQVAERLEALELGLARLQQEADWTSLLDLLVALHRLDGPTLRAWLEQGGQAARWGEVEALRDSMRRLAAEEEPMHPRTRRERLLKLGDELLTALGSCAAAR